MLRNLLLSLMLLPLSSCLVREVQVEVPVEPCPVPPIPPRPRTDAIAGGDCPAGYVCQLRDIAVGVGTYIRESQRSREALGACPYVRTP